MRKLFRIFWIAVALGAVFFWIYFPAISHYRELKMQEAELDRKILELDAKIEGMREERDRLKNDVAYIEKIIRDELGLVKPGEIVYKFVPDETLPPSPAVPPAPAAPGTASPTPKPRPAGTNNPH